jgi:hypothetical protein
VTLKRDLAGTRGAASPGLIMIVIISFTPCPPPGPSIPIPVLLGAEDDVDPLGPCGDEGDELGDIPPGLPPCPRGIGIEDDDLVVPPLPPCPGLGLTIVNASIASTFGPSSLGQSL